MEREVKHGLTAYRKPPRIVKRSPIKHPFRRDAVPGYVAWCHSRQENIYYSPRSSDRNLLHLHNSYPISAPIIGQLQSDEIDCSRIYIAERDTGNVYEYRIDDYLNAPQYNWEVEDDHGRTKYEDLQFCPSIDPDDEHGPYHIWEELGSDLFHSPV